MQEPNVDDTWQHAAQTALARGDFRAVRRLVAAHKNDPAAQPLRERYAADPLIIGLSVACAALFLGIVLFNWVIK